MVIAELTDFQAARAQFQAGQGAGPHTGAMLASSGSIDANGDSG